MLASLLVGLSLLPGAAAAQSFGPAFEALRAQGAMAGAESPAVPAPPSSADVWNANEAASDVFGRVTAGMPAELRARMRERVDVTVVPRGERIVDAVAAALRRKLPPDEAEAQIQSLRASYARRVDVDPADVRRTPAEPRGFTGYYGSLVLTFVGAENLTTAGAWDENGSRARRILFHELGHAAFDVVGNEEMWAFMKELAHGGDGSELWAESTERWFGVYQSRVGIGSPSDKDLSSLDPRLTNLLRVIYGPRRAPEAK